MVSHLGGAHRQVHSIFAPLLRATFSHSSGNGVNFKNQEASSAVPRCTNMILVTRLSVGPETILSEE